MSYRLCIDSAVSMVNEIERERPKFNCKSCSFATKICKVIDAESLSINTAKTDILHIRAADIHCCKGLLSIEDKSNIKPVQCTKGDAEATNRCANCKHATKVVLPYDMDKYTANMSKQDKRQFKNCIATITVYKCAYDLVDDVANMAYYECDKHKKRDANVKEQ